MDGVAEVKALLDEYNEVLAAWADPDADYEELGARQQRLEDKIAAADAWNLEYAPSRWPWTPCGSLPVTGT